MPALLLIMGLGSQMLLWEEDFCDQLAERGFWVIRFDNRDVGRSTILRGAHVPTRLELVLRDRRAAAYTLSDMADDILAGRAEGACVVQVAPSPDVIDVAPLGLRKDGASIYRPPGEARWVTAEQRGRSQPRSRASAAPASRSASSPE